MVADDEVQYSEAVIGALVAFKPPTQLPGVVVSQSVAANTPVQRGTTISVRVLSPSVLPASALNSDALPAAIKDSPVDQLIEIQKSDPSIAAAAADPTTASDPAKAAAFTQKVSAALGKNLVASDAAGLASALRLAGG